MELRFQTPAWALVALLALLPLAALALGDRRVRRVRALLRLAPPARPPLLVPALALTAVAVLVGTAAAQPVLVEEERALVRRDVEALFLLDVSRSMLAAEAPGAPTRFVRAREAAKELRASIPEIAAGVASLTDRVLPHLFPTHDAPVFEATLDRTLAAGRIPPLAGGARASSLAPVAELGLRSYFTDGLAGRVVVVLTDGEMVELEPSRVRATLDAGPPLDVVILRTAAAGERVYRRDGTSEAYRTDPDAPAELDAFAAGLGFRVADDPAEAGALLRRAVGRSEVAEESERRRTRALAPWVVLAALAPLGVLLGRRNRA